MAVSVSEILFSFVGGLGLFLFGLRFMSDGLQSVAGDRMRSILEKGTSTPIRGVMTGALVTALIQSSSATTVLTVGLVNAQLLTLRQAIGVIMGANIGTTLTAYLIGFNLQDYALPILGLGALVFLFSKNKKYQVIGQAILGFGILFFGLTIMGSGMKPLKDLPLFIDLMSSIDNNSIIGVLIGMFFTFLIQSSSATIGVLQQLAYEGAVTYNQAVPILFGDNIGTTITALLAGLGASVAARRTALTHFLFNSIGTVIFLPLFLMGVFKKIVVILTNYIFILLPGFAGTWDTLNIKLQIAQTHAVFNLSNTLIQLPLVAVLAFIVTKLIPEKAEDIDDQYRPKYIDRRLLNNPSVALSQAKRETLRMAYLAQDAFNNAVDYFNSRQEALLKKGKDLENAIDRMEREITDYVVLASQKQLSEEESNDAYIILQSLNDIERIGDHCENIIEQGSYASKYQVNFSGEARNEMDKIIEITNNALLLTYKALERQDKSVARLVLTHEEAIDDLQASYRKAHIRRLNEGICNGNNGAVFLDMLANLERIGDHCRNIAEYILGEE
ncbi:MAG: Na/Pi cotransporter family protein [Syntrophomonadaceae bacterium]|nr:Na/Pi cotransporter family protein [Syntrophomonadaceae bacterium]MDD3022583.1 Na/Pi cotransporter family protein [Syntrophomonadaceae bacterium]